MTDIEITDRDIDSYDRDGAVVLRGAFGPAWLDRLAAGVEKDVAAPGPLHTLQQTADEPGYFLTDFCMAQRIPEFRDFVAHSPAAEIAARIMRARRVNFFYDAIWVKGRATPKRSRWHQDQPYYCVDGHQFCALWLCLDPIRRDTCLELLGGSHRWGRWFKPELTQHGQDLYPEADSLERLPDIEADRDAYDILAWDMAPGDCILFHALTVHGAPGNRSDEHWRRAVSTFWMGDDAVFTTRPGKARPLFEGHGLAPGEAMDCAHFPRVWPPERKSDPAESARFTDPGFRISI